MVDSKEYNLFKGLEHQPLAIKFLEESIKKKKIAPAYLFTGPKGVGQTNFALRFLEGLITNGLEKKELRFRLEKLNHPDLLWIEPTYINEGKLIKRSEAQKQGFQNKMPPQIRLEQIRDIKLFLSKKPVESKLGMIILEDVDNINESASNALLKTLEEPMNGILVLISSRKDKLLETIKSRCQIIPFSGLSYDLMKKEFINKKDESKIIKFEQELLNLSHGSPDLLEENIKFFKNIPSTIIEEIQELPKDYLEALTYAKKITEELNKEEQLWLINFLQHRFWGKNSSLFIANRFEKLRNHLIISVQPRIAWEIAFIELTGIN